MLMMLKPHTVLFIAPTGTGKTHLALDLLEHAYFNHFDFIIILCTTLKYNTTCRSRKWFWTNPYIIPIDTGDQLYCWIEKFGNPLAGWKALFLIDDIIANETLDKQRQPLLGLAILGRHKGQMLWLLMQSYTAVPINIRRQEKCFMFGIRKSEETEIAFMKRTTSSKHERT